MSPTNHDLDYLNVQLALMGLAIAIQAEEYQDVKKFEKPTRNIFTAFFPSFNRRKIISDPEKQQEQEAKAKLAKEVASDLAAPLIAALTGPIVRRFDGLKKKAEKFLDDFNKEIVVPISKEFEQFGNEIIEELYRELPMVQNDIANYLNSVARRTKDKSVQDLVDQINVDIALDIETFRTTRNRKKAFDAMDRMAVRESAELTSSVTGAVIAAGALAALPNLPGILLMGFSSCLLIAQYMNNPEKAEKLFAEFKQNVAKKEQEAKERSFVDELIKSETELHEYLEILEQRTKTQQELLKAKKELLKTLQDTNKQRDKKQSDNQSLTFLEECADAVANTLIEFNKFQAEFRKLGTVQDGAKIIQDKVEEQVEKIKTGLN